ncbi:winged helix DNA-binding protein [Microbacterium betulae]|uniref:Winged helix DNA-binding protein n=1 Tax=Microbacterium betulae TaxID=2981139 RepID=A0AA97I6F0_9MICO|nr:MarR family transcriptional regulator [Microbacterium sp. AB]WOF24781.1 winged helix DNA-binding protein [Microbacterium sp. AB]
MSGAGFARLVLGAFDSMVEQVRAELARAGHPDLTVANEFAIQAIDEGASSAADLARALGVTRQAAAKTITSLEGLRYVTRTSDEEDARRKHLVVTDHGHEAVAIGATAFDDVYQRWHCTVGADTAATVEEALRTLTDRKEAAEADARCRHRRPRRADSPRADPAGSADHPDP